MHVVEISLSHSKFKDLQIFFRGCKNLFTNWKCLELIEIWGFKKLKQWFLVTFAIHHQVVWVTITVCWQSGNWAHPKRTLWKSAKSQNNSRKQKKWASELYLEKRNYLVHFKTTSYLDLDLLVSVTKAWKEGMKTSLKSLCNYFHVAQFKSWTA